MIDFETLSKTVVDALAHGVSGEVAYYGWVESLGFAMIDNITVSVGSHECERITGDALYIQNELMRSEEQRYNCQHVLKTGRALVEQEFYHDTRVLQNTTLCCRGMLTTTTGLACCVLLERMALPPLFAADGTTALTDALQLPLRRRREVRSMMGSD